MTDEAEFELWQEGLCVSTAFGPREQARAEILHYAMMFGQDGPVEIFEVKRVLEPVDLSGETP